MDPSKDPFDIKLEVSCMKKTLQEIDLFMENLPLAWNGISLVGVEVETCTNPTERSEG